MTGKPRARLGSRAARAQAAEDLQALSAKEAKKGRARGRAAYNAELEAGLDRQALADALARVLAEREAAPAPRRRRGGPQAEPLATATDRWVPIGPSVVRRGQAVDRPRVSGRVRDLAVHRDGVRAYAATARGGVWYTGDGGATWAPVGAWAEPARTVGGSNLADACGCILVNFGATSAQDFVMVGTGEINPVELAHGEWTSGGVGVLCALDPVGRAAVNPWEPDAGLAQLENLGIYRLARHPAARAGSAAGATQDVVVAATSNGLYIGRRQPLPAVVGPPPLPARDGFVWTQAADVSWQGPITDVLFLPGGRLVACAVGVGLVVSDDLATTAAVPVASVAGLGLLGRFSVAGPTAWTEGPPAHFEWRTSGNRLYLLGETGPMAISLTRIPDASIAAPAAAAVSGVTNALWQIAPALGNQRDYDQAIAVDTSGANDRVFVGGSSAQAFVGADWGASLWCYDIVAAPPAPPPPTPFIAQAAVGISDTAAPPAGAAADTAGMIGNSVHGDVHAIRLAGTGAPSPQVWIACDGGVFASERSGVVGSFAARNTGLATLQPVYARSHQVNGHLVGAGFQDNGTQVRTGDTLWDLQFVSDGGGVAFVPTAPHVFVNQQFGGVWRTNNAAAFVAPPLANADVTGASFYSGAAVTRVPPVGATPARSRVAIGTYRVWLSDDVGVAAPNTWRVLRSISGQPVAPPGPGFSVNTAVGQAAPVRGPIRTMKWVPPPGANDRPRVLLVVHQMAVVRYTESAAGSWSTRAWRIDNLNVAIPRTTTLTDVAPVPGTSNFYVATTGVVGADDETLWFYEDASGRFRRTGFRRVLATGPPPAPAGPRDPVFAVVVDPADPTVVYVGTATGVWRGTRTNNQGAHEWRAAPNGPLVNGIPQAMVQDLDIWVDPITPTPATSPRLLRAALQSRGMWETDLAHPGERRTWIRSHAWDNRRMPLAVDATPLTPPPVLPDLLMDSPDIVVRPRWSLATAPVFGGPTMDPTVPASFTPYRLWTFQTAFRWLHPSVVADGQFSRNLQRLVRVHRRSMAPAKTDVPQIDADVWNDVVGRVRVKPDGTPGAGADPLAVYRAPWHTRSAPDAPATEIDLAETVIPPTTVGTEWVVFKERSTVDVLLHHRDSRPVPANGAWAILLWRSAPTAAALMSVDPTQALAWVVTAVTGVNPPAPAGWGWNRAGGGAGVAWNTLPIPIDARLPRAVSFDVDLAAVPDNHHVLFLAIVGSSADDARLVPTTSAAATVPPVTVTQLVQCWPYAAARVVQVLPRPT
ncbi:MAG: hypothetical protein LCH60_07885 [Actinobacteria bacterium]|nr:hypothetical protein [Actinomycetota bacterium]